MARVGILLLNLGGPERIQDVGPFLYNLFADPEIIRLPNPILQKPLAWLISTLRSSKSQEAYRSIGGGSPLRRITEQQARELQRAPESREQDPEIAKITLRRLPESHFGSRAQKCSKSASRGLLRAISGAGRRNAQNQPPEAA